MTFPEVIKMVDTLSREELRQLRLYIEEREQQSVQDLTQLPVSEWTHRMQTAAATIREGFTDAEWAAIERDMNTEYIETVDEDVWRD